MEMALNVGSFEVLDQQELHMLDGGASTGGKALVATASAVLIAWAPIAAIATVATGGLGAIAIGTALTMIGTGVTGIATTTH